MSTFDELLTAFVDLTRAAEFDPSQKRDDVGQWTDGGGGGKRKKSNPKSTKNKPAGKDDTQLMTGQSIPEEGGAFRMLPDGGVEWVPTKASGETPSEKKGRTEVPPSSHRPSTTVDYQGAKIVTPKDLDPAQQRLQTDDVKSFIDQIPAEHRGVISEIRLSDEFYKEKSGRGNSDYGATYYPDSGRIEIHSTAKFADMDPERLKTVFAGVVRHEAAHALTDKLTPEFVKEWQKASKQDGAAITDYAKTDTHEDIAETIAAYWSPDKFERASVDRFFPARAALLKRYAIRAGGS